MYACNNLDDELDDFRGYSKLCTDYDMLDTFISKFPVDTFQAKVKRENFIGRRKDCLGMINTYIGPTSERVYKKLNLQLLAIFLSTQHIFLPLLTRFSQLSAAYAWGRGAWAVGHYFVSIKWVRSWGKGGVRSQDGSVPNVRKSSSMMTFSSYTSLEIFLNNVLQNLPPPQTWFWKSCSSDFLRRAVFFHDHLVNFYSN